MDAYDALGLMQYGLTDVDLRRVRRWFENRQHDQLLVLHACTVNLSTPSS